MADLVPEDGLVRVEKVPDNENVYRALLYEDWVEEDENGDRAVSDAAFFRRPRDTDGISIQRSTFWLLINLGSHFRSPIFGAGDLLPAVIRAILCSAGHLDCQTDERDKPGHGKITNAPYEREAEAEHIASELSRIATYRPTS